MIELPLPPAPTSTPTISDLSNVVFLKVHDAETPFKSLSDVHQSDSETHSSANQHLFGDGGNLSGNVWRKKYHSGDHLKDGMQNPNNNNNNVNPNLNPYSDTTHNTSEICSPISVIFVNTFPEISHKGVYIDSDDGTLNPDRINEIKRLQEEMAMAVQCAGGNGNVGGGGGGGKQQYNQYNGGLNGSCLADGYFDVVVLRMCPPLVRYS
jgi:hypothetical protein